MVSVHLLSKSLENLAFKVVSKLQAQQSLIFQSLIRQLNLP